MHRRSFIFVMVAVLLLACRFTSVEQISPTATAIPLATDTHVPATQPPDPSSITQTPGSETILTLDWLSQMEVIDAGNWSRVQLLQSFPAEMPLSSAMAISPDGKTMAVGSKSDARIFFFDVANGQLSQTVSIGLSHVGEYFSLNEMEYLPDGTIMLNSGGPYKIYHINADGNVLSEWDGVDFAISADKKIMAHSTSEAGIVLTDIKTNTTLLSLEDPDALGFSFSPDGSTIAAEDVGVDYLHIEIWDVANRTLLKTLDETANPRFSPDGKFLAVTYYDYENDRTPLKILSPDGATEIATLNINEPNGLSNRASLWSADSSLIMGQIANGSPIAWDATNWQPLDAPALQGELHSISPDGRTLITRTPDGGVLLWGVLQ